MQRQSMPRIDIPLGRDFLRLVQSHEHHQPHKAEQEHKESMEGAEQDGSLFRGDLLVRFVSGFHVR